MLKYLLNRIYALMLVLSVIFLFSCTPTLNAQWSSPIGYTPYAGFRLYANGANAGSDSLNQNLLDADSLLKAHQDTLNVLKADVYNVIDYNGGIKDGSVSFNDLSTAAKANLVQTTGTQTISGIKTFTSPIVSDITGNAGTVTNGVYTTGSQSIAGAKTFTDAISSAGSSPYLNDTYDLGSAAKIWHKLYAGSWVSDALGVVTTISPGMPTVDRTISFPDASGTVVVFGTTAPASAVATGTVGEIRVVSGYIYVCVATNTWQRAALTTW